MIVCILTGANNHFLGAQEADSIRTQPVFPDNPADTLPVFYSLVLDPAKLYPADDTLPDLAFRMYDPSRRQGAFDYGHLGNLGTAARPLAFETRSRVGFETGMHAFDLYQLKPEDLRFYRHTRTYSHAGFSRGRTQRDAASFIKLSRTFEKGLNFSLHYQTFNNLGEYRFQRVKHSALSAGMWWPVRKNYEIFLIYAGNTNQQEDNGGITVTDMFFDSIVYNGPISVPVRFSNEAKTKHKRNNLQLSQFATIGKARNQLQVQHQLNLRSESWKFSDTNSPRDGEVTAEEAFYATYLKDPRGVRHYFDLWRLDNHVTVSTLRKRKTAGEAMRISAGVRHSLINLYREPLPDSTINNLFLTGKVAIQPSERLALIANGDLGLLANGTEYRLEGRVLFDLGKAGILEGSLLSQRRPADLVQTRLISAANPVWNINNFNKPIENSLSATYRLPKLGFRAQFNNHIVNNYIYFDQSGRPAQASSVLQVSQLAVLQRLNVGRLRSEHSFALQQINQESIVRLPNWYAKSSVAVEGRLFKKALLANVGADIRLNGAFTPDAYQPFVGQFHLQDTIRQATYPWIDIFTSVKIQTFRLYFRFENIAPFWNPTKNLYLTANHPQNRTTFRLGISWRFLDRNQAGADDQQDGGGTGGSSGPPAGIGRGF